MRRSSLLIVSLILLAGLSVLAQSQVAISGKQIRGVPSRDGRLKSDGVKLPRPGTIVEAVSGGDGFWIEDNLGIVMEYHKTSDAVGKPLDAGGPYRVYPFLKKTQNETSCHIRVTY